MADRYWVGGTANWDATAGTKWATTSGGAGGASVPGTGDIAYFDGSSGSGTVTRTVSTGLQGLVCTGFTGTLTGSQTLSVSTAVGVVLGSGMTWSWTGAITLNFNGAIAFIPAGKTLNHSLTFAGGSSAVVTLTEDFLFATNRVVTLTNGTLDLNGFDLSCGTFNSFNSNVRTLSLGTGTLSLASGGTPWDFSTTTNLTFNAGTSTLKFTASGTFNKSMFLGGLTYNNIWLSGGGLGPWLFFDAGTFNNFKCDAPPNVIRFSAGTTYTVSSFSVVGTAGNLITLNSRTAASAFTIAKAGGGVVGADYLAIQDSTASPGSTWYAGANSTNNGNNTGWTFTAPPPEIVPVTGEVGTTALGDVVVSLPIVVPVTGVAGISALGTVIATGGAVVAVTGEVATGEVGDVSIANDFVVAVTGVAGTTALGTVFVALGSTVSVTGIGMQAHLGGVVIWLSIGDNQTPNWSPVPDSQTPSWTPVASTQIPGWTN